jgi:hypothetical protein
VSRETPCSTAVAAISASAAGTTQPRARALRYRHVRARLRELAAVAADGDVEAAWECVQIVLDLEGEEEALPLLRDLVARAPDHGPASFALGQILADRDDASAIPHLERAMVRNVLARPPARDAIAALFERLGRDAEAVAHQRRAWDARALLSRAAAERRHVGVLAVLVPHDLASDVVVRVRERLAQMGTVRAAWLAKKKLAYLPESPLYVLGVVSSARVGWAGHPTHRRADAAARAGLRGDRRSRDAFETPADPRGTHSVMGGFRYTRNNTPRALTPVARPTASA